MERSTLPQSSKKDRAAGVIVRNNQILLFHRFCDGREYWVIPGGSIEPSETPDIAVDRELNEELGITVLSKKLIFLVENLGRNEYHFLIQDFSGEPKLGGPEALRATEKNQYIITWVSLVDIPELKNFYPQSAVSELISLARIV